MNTSAAKILLYLALRTIWNFLKMKLYFFLREQVEIATHIFKRFLFLCSNNFYLRSLVSANVFKLFFSTQGTYGYFDLFIA